ncbi:MAG: hypothetical protein P8Z41_12030, partial [Anaerolineales bacterium]
RRAALERYPRARSFAERAVDVFDDPFTRNTLGTIILKTAIDYADHEYKEAERLYWEGVNELRASKRAARRTFEHPFVTFFSHTIRYFEKGPYAGPIPDDVRREWDQWMQDAQQARVFRHPIVQQSLTDFQTRWLKLNLEKGSNEDR